MSATSLQLPALGLSFDWPSAEFKKQEFRPLDLQKLSLAALDSINAALEGQNGGVTAVPAQVAVTTTVVTLLAASTYGRKCAIYNHGDNAVIISDGGTPASGAGTAVIYPGGYWERPVCAKSAVKGLVLAGSSTVTVTTY